MLHVLGQYERDVEKKLTVTIFRSKGLFGKKKDKLRPRFSPDTSHLRGALSWRIVVEDCGNASGITPEIEAFLAISPDSLIVVQDNSHHDVIFVTATKAVIGWTNTQTSIRIYFHQGEALIVHSKDPDSDDMSEISQRLKSVSEGAATQEFSLRRNHLGQLGFHVQHDGLVTEVENFGYAWQTGLRQGSRLVEVRCAQNLCNIIKNNYTAFTLIICHSRLIQKRGLSRSEKARYKQQGS